MSVPRERRPGQFAEERFRERHRLWLRRVWWIFPPACLVIVALYWAIRLAIGQAHFFLGMGIGAASMLVVAVSDSPPHYIETWREGADGEKRTARALKPLTRQGWALIHDLEQRWGNIDHVLIGPPGVFLLESKNLNGRVSVNDGRLVVRWREDPNHGYENTTITRNAKSAAANLSTAIRAPGLKRAWIQPVVVLWANFEQGTTESQGVIWADGRALVTELQSKHAQLTPENIAELRKRIVTADIGRPTA